MCLLLFASFTSGGEPKPSDFVHDVVPILKAHCAECHTDGAHKGGLSLDTRETILMAKAVVPGKSEESELVKRITSTDAEMRMPPKGKPLTAQEIDSIKTWIDGGMKWEDGFSFRRNAYVPALRPRQPVIPPAVAGRDHPIDRIVDAYLANNKIPLLEAADDIAFVRRIFLDVIGQLPAPSETEAFLKDGDPKKKEKLARSLLADKRAYADHWLSFWNDLLRNDYAGTGFIDGGRKQISAWLYSSLVDNKPYDVFARELIAPSPDSEGFIKGIQWRGNVNASQVTELQFAQNVGPSFFRHQPQMRIPVTTASSTRGNWMMPTAWRPSSPIDRSRSIAATSQQANGQSRASCFPN